MTWKLFLDDERTLPRCLENSGFTVARTVEEARSLTFKHGLPCEIWLDHDLGVGAAGGDAPNYLKWLIGMLMDNGHERAAANIAVRVHSHNSVGARNMQELWQGFVEAVVGTKVNVPYTPYSYNMPY